jgi:hypothetical protein
MDSAPLRSYLGVSHSSNKDDVLIHFLDAEIVDKLTAYKDELTQSRIINLPADRTMTYENFLLLAPAIIPGLDKKGSPTLSVLPNSWSPDVIISDTETHSINWDLSNDIVAKLFPSKFGQNVVKRSRIYVESSLQNQGDNEKAYIVIGHAAYPLPEALDDGSLEWLRSFESGTADIVYLGDLSEASDSFINKRIEYFHNNGFIECAESYDRFLNSLDDPDSLVSIQEKSLPLIKYADAWLSYVDYHVELDADPPQWFFTDFLVKLGFDRMVMDIPEVK